MNARTTFARTGLPAILARALACLLLIAPLGSIPSFAAATNADRIAFEAWLENESVSQGEPLILRIRLANRNGSTVVLNMVNADGWLRANLTDANGVPVTARTSAAAMACAGNRPGTRSAIAPVLVPGAAHHDRLVLSRRFAVDSPGEYRLRLDLSIPYIGDGRPIAGTVTASRTLAFTVRPLDPDRLRASAQASLEQAMGDGPARPRGAAVEALLSLPLVEAGPFLRRLLREGPEDAVRHAMDEMVRDNRVEGADLLAGVAWDAARPAALRARARAALLNLWWTGDAPTRRSVESSFIRHEGALPETAFPPILM